MSKQSEARVAQKYVPKCVPSVCSNCLHFTKEVTTHKNFYRETYTVDRNLRCGIGGFAVKKMGTCIQWSAPTAAGEQK
ncbi:MAG TPA: hypothetical protein VHL05_14955 [Terriglobales bacterium]|jgi:hypothetical protein|nr:hypothetical protein [Terriglobales bacterium]